MYADHDFYIDSYYGNVIAKEDFPRLSERASDYVRWATKGISDRVDGETLEAVKKASCAVAEVLLDEESMTASTFSGGASVASEAVGSWSRSFKTPSLSAAEVEYINNRKRDALLLYLGNLAAFRDIFKVRSYKCIHSAGYPGG